MEPTIRAVAAICASLRGIPVWLSSPARRTLTVDRRGQIRLLVFSGWLPDESLNTRLAELAAITI